MSEVLTGENFGKYGKSFQEKVLQALLSDPRWAEQLMEVFDPKYLDLKYLQFLSERYFDYAKKYKGEFPSVQLLATIIRDELKVGNDKQMAEQIVDFLRRVQTNPNPSDLPFVKDKALDFCRRQALKGALEKAVDLVASEKYESIVDLLKNAVSVGTTPSLGHDLIEDMDARFVSLVRRCVPTGIPQLDAKEIMQGGLGKGELGVICAPTGVGKCSVSSTKINVRYVGIRIGNTLYKPWQKISTKRGLIFAKDILETDELS